jgi:hypothetical protein
VRISAPQGKHDDLVTVTVLCAAMAIKFESFGKPVEEDENRVKTPYEKIMAQLNAQSKKEEDKEFL